MPKNFVYRSHLLRVVLSAALIAVGTTALAQTPKVRLELAAEGFTAPTMLVPAPDDTGRLFVLDQVGVIKIINANGQLAQKPFLDVRDKLVDLDKSYDERGLLGLAFHPDYTQNGRFYVYYSAPLRESGPSGWSSTSHVSEFQVSDDPNQADAGSEKVLLRVDEPQLNHNGGHVTFGPDGYLYIPLGDGGGANDEDDGHVEDWYKVNDGGNGQDLSTNLLGTILRIDVDKQQGNKAYAVPEDNPFVGQDGAEEVWAYGLRNPWAISFDQDGTLYAADLGQKLYEEVNIIKKGGNYGWNVKEGTHCFSTRAPEQPPKKCPSQAPDGTPLVDPVLEHNHDVGIAIIGGYVYHGDTFPALQGQYLFGNHAKSEDNHHGVLLSATPKQTGMWSFEKLQVVGGEKGGLLPGRLLSFGQDAQGEPYVLTSEAEGPTGSTGKVYRLVSAE